MGLYNRAIRTQRTPDRPGTHEGVLKKLLRTNPDTRRYASSVAGATMTGRGRDASAEDTHGDGMTVTLAARDVEKKKS